MMTRHKFNEMSDKNPIKELMDEASKFGERVRVAETNGNRALKKFLREEWVTFRESVSSEDRFLVVQAYYDKYCD